MSRQSVSLFTVAAILAFAISSASGQRHAAESAALKEFRVAVEEYVALHRHLERQVPALQLTENAQEIFDSSNALAAALRAARPKSREGDLFAPPVAKTLRQLIADALAANDILPEDVVAANLDEVAEDAEWPVVNGRFPWMRGAGMWPCILNALPALPDELQYRVVGRDLVLVDVHADLVVDILRQAIR
jgi:hypothetical protein